MTQQILQLTKPNHSGTTIFCADTKVLLSKLETQWVRSAFVCSSSSPTEPQGIWLCAIYFAVSKPCVSASEDLSGIVDRPNNGARMCTREALPAHAHTRYTHNPIGVHLGRYERIFSPRIFFREQSPGRARPTRLKCKTFQAPFTFVFRVSKTKSLKPTTPLSEWPPPEEWHTPTPTVVLFRF